MRGKGGGYICLEGCGLMEGRRAHKREAAPASTPCIADPPPGDRSPPHAAHSTCRTSSNATSNVPRPPLRNPWLRLPVPGKAACERAFAHGMRGVPALCTAATQTSA